MDRELEEEILVIAKQEYPEDIYEELKKQTLGQSSREIDIEILGEGHETDLVASKNELDFDIFTKMLIETEHLDNYNALDNDLGLVGEGYEPLKKFLWYYHNSLKQETRSYQINRRTKTDNRKHGLIITSAGAGKTTIKNQIKRIADKRDVYETTGLSHPEQLVGTTRHKGNEVKKILGILSYKSVLNDESQDLLNEINDIYAKSQRIKRLAMDCYGENTISKKLVDDDPNDVLSYDPTTRILDFAHPKKLHSAFFDTGSFRRYDIFNLVYDPDIDINNITEFKHNTEEELQENYGEILNNFYARKRVNVSFSQETLDIISHFHKCLLFYLLKHPNKNVFRYGLLTRYAMRVSFCKNVFILAMAKNHKTPTREMTINACGDTMLFILKSIEAINDLGDMGITSDVWGGLKEQDAEACEFLLRKGATSPDLSNISIKEFWSVLANLYGTRITQARMHYYRLKRDGFVEGKRTGKIGSVVWLKYRPKDIVIDSKNFDQLGYWDKHTSVGNEKSILSLVKQVFTDDKSFKRATSVGSVGVLGCVLAVYKKKKKEIEFHKGLATLVAYPPTPTHLTLVDNKTSLSTIKQLFTSDKTKKPNPTLANPKPKKPLTDRKVQFYDAPECQDIKPTCTEKDVLNYIKKNPKTNYKAIYDEFGVGSIRFKNGLIVRGLVEVSNDNKLTAQGGSDDLQ